MERTKAVRIGTLDETLEKKDRRKPSLLCLLSGITANLVFSVVAWLLTLSSVWLIAIFVFWVADC